METPRNRERSCIWELYSHPPLAVSPDDHRLHVIYQRGIYEPTKVVEGVDECRHETIDVRAMGKLEVAAPRATKGSCETRDVALMAPLVDVGKDPPVEAQLMSRLGSMAPGNNHARGNRGTDLTYVVPHDRLFALTPRAVKRSTIAGAE